MQRFAELEQRLTSAQQAARHSRPPRRSAGQIRRRPACRRRHRRPRRCRRARCLRAPRGTCIPPAIAPAPTHDYPRRRAVRSRHCPHWRSRATAHATAQQAWAPSADATNPLHLPAGQLHARHAAGRAGCAHRRPVAVQPAPGADPPVGQLGAAQPLPRRVPRVLRDRRRLRRHQFRARLPAHREPVLRARRRRHAGSEDPGQRLWRGRQGRHARAPGHQAGPDAGQRAAGRRGQRHRPGPGHLVDEYSTSALGTVASASGADAYRAGLGTGVGKALDRLAQYYIKLAENTFPVIEVDAGREIDVVITKGVRIDVPMRPPSAPSGRPAPSHDP
jgi:conjugal transfer pilus assembly protein TraB